MKINIIAGKYKHHQTGVYLRPYGTKMACVKVDGDSQQERNLLLTSITPRKEDNDTITVDRIEYEQLLKEMAGLKLTVNKLSTRLNELNSKR